MTDDEQPTGSEGDESSGSANEPWAPPAGPAADPSSDPTLPGADHAEAPPRPTAGGPSWAAANQPATDGPTPSPYEPPAPAPGFPATPGPGPGPGPRPSFPGGPTPSATPPGFPGAGVPATPPSFPGAGSPVPPHGPTAPGFPGAPQQPGTTTPFGVPTAPPFAGAVAPPNVVGTSVASATWSPGGTAPQPYVPPTPRSTTRTLGLPPALGLAAALMSFPAVATVFYGVIALVGGLFISNSSSFDDEFNSDWNSFGSSVAMAGAIGLAIGLLGLFGVVMLMAGNAVGRTICTIFLVIATFLSALQLGLGSPPLGFFFLIVNAYCFWAIWGRPAKGIF